MEERRGDIGRRQADRVLGEIVVTIEFLKETLERHIEEESHEVAETKAMLVEMKQDLALKFRTAETVFKTLKFLGLVVVAVLTFKFGDVRLLWQSFFS